MCGIFAYLSSNEKIKENYGKISHRGPDSSKHITIPFNNTQLFLGFHRLAINGLDEISNQPMKDVENTVVLICNGEIFNYKELIQEHQFENEYTSNSDCEIIIHLYKKYGIEITCQLLDGEFSFILVDLRDNTLYIARDQLGIRSLYWDYEYESTISLSVCSELKGINEISVHPVQFPPAHYWSSKTNKTVPFFNYVSPIINESEDEIIQNIRFLFEKAVNKRLMSDRDVACLLSGGLDSSTVAALVAKNYKKTGDGRLNTYSIGLKGSVDLYYADLMSKHIKSHHTNIELTEEDFLNAIDKTIKQIESYDTTSVRASVGNYLVSLYIKENSDDKVIFCGDVSDEIFASYRGFSGEHDDAEFYSENVKMLNHIHYFDVLRSDKTISGAGLEARVPFGDKDFIEYVMKIPAKHKMFNKTRMEKYLFRRAFADILPDEILWRRKEAFSDGVSSMERSWFQIIKEFVDTKYSDDDFDRLSKTYTHNQPYDKESLFYREIFEKYYPNMDYTIPYFWRHPFSTQIDPSARLLSNYTE
jgi:asparagine synthase (glutamine-hydrolysing)